MGNDRMSPFSFLPEGCIANIISLTSPKDACMAAAVSWGFKSAAESDTVWERFLPAEYEEKICQSSSQATFSTKKEIYLHHCESSVLLNQGKMSLRLIKSSGKKCYMLSARELQIDWKDSPIYWNWTSLPESRFSEVAELLNVCWLDIRGTFTSRRLSPDTNYGAYLVFKLSDDHYGLDATLKASIKCVRAIRTAEAEENVRTAHVCIIPPRLGRWIVRRGRRVPLPSPDVDDGPVTATDGWKEIELGEFYVARGDEFDVEIRLFETDILNCKRGLIVEGIEVRPKREEAV